MHIAENISLKPYNTFGLDVPAAFLAEIDNEELLKEVSALPQKKYVLGGGSNVLLSKPVDGIVLLNKLKGIEVEKDDEDHIWVRVQSGEVWHELVMHAIEHGWAGIENLALIPGTCGAAPMQNIGAYGVEAKDTIDSVTCWNWEDQGFVSYTNSECKFGYRDSIFKHELKDKVFISSVLFRFNKNPVYHTDYGAIAQELQHIGIQEFTIKDIAQAVINIRTSKLPDPKQIGNAGSFFKNPTIKADHFELLHTNYPSIPSYPAGEGMVKIPAGWLIEQCGWKGYREGDAGVHAKQALVIVNYGNATGEQLWELSGSIKDSVQQRFDIELEREVQVW